MVSAVVFVVGVLVALSTYALLAASGRRESSRSRPGVRAVIAVTAGVSVALALVVVLGEFRGVTAGIPNFPSLAAHPDATLRGTVAFNRLPIGTPQGVKLGCVDVVDASGANRRQLFCEPQPKAMDAELVWLGDNRLMATNRGQDHWRTIVDVLSATRTNAPWVKPRGPAATLARGPQSQTLDATISRGRLRLTMRGDGTTRTLLDVAVPRYYTLEQVAWSPDGRWFVVQDSAARLLVVTTGTHPSTRMLIDGGTSAAVTNTVFATARS